MKSCESCIQKWEWSINPKLGFKRGFSLFQTSDSKICFFSSHFFIPWPRSVSLLPLRKKTKTENTSKKCIWFQMSIFLVETQFFYSIMKGYGKYLSLKWIKLIKLFMIFLYIIIQTTNTCLLIGLGYKSTVPPFLPDNL